MGDLGDKRLLLVDDDPQVLGLLEMVCRRAGFGEVRAARTGGEARALLGLDGGVAGEALFRADVAVLDLVLPDCSGFDLCVDLRAALGTRVGLVLITGMEIEDLHARCIQAGADDFLSKPVQPRELLARVKLLLERRLADTDQVVAGDASLPGAGRGHQLAPGQTIGEYRIAELLTWSGSSVVYRGECRDGGGACVIKLLTAQAAEYPDVVARFGRECDMLSRLDHPNIIHLIDHGFLGGSPFSVMEFVQGQTLEDILSQSGPLPFGMLMSVADGIARGLGHAHLQDIIHRDVKPKNVLLSLAGEVKIGDFGIALRQGESRLTQTGYSLGTPLYMAPEQFDGKPATPATDVYAYGATLYHLLAGRPPFSADNAIALMRKHEQDPPPPLSMHRPGVPSAWEQFVVDRCLAKGPGERPQSMDEILTQLEDLRRHRF